MAVNVGGQRDKHRRALYINAFRKVGVNVGDAANQLGKGSSIADFIGLTVARQAAVQADDEADGNGQKAGCEDPDEKTNRFFHDRELLPQFGLFLSCGEKRKIIRLSQYPR